jgi:hypothetical protein
VGDGDGEQGGQDSHAHADGGADDSPDRGAHDAVTAALHDSGRDARDQAQHAEQVDQ